MRVHLRAVGPEDEVVKGEIRVLKKPYVDEKLSTEPRRPKIKAQKEIFDYWDLKWNRMIDEIKKEVEAVIAQ